MNSIKKPNLNYIPLHGAFLLYSFSGVLSKMAAGHEFLSVPFVILYGGSVSVLALYSIVWQLLLRRFPLNTAYSNKGAVVIWGIVWGAVFFSEPLNAAKVIAAALIAVGITLTGRFDG